MRRLHDVLLLVAALLAVLLALDRQSGLSPSSSIPRVGGPQGRQNQACSRVFLLIPDSMRLQTALDPTIMPALADLRKKGASARLETVYEGYSEPAFRAMFTGTEQTRILNVVGNFYDVGLKVPSLFDQVAAAGLTAADYAGPHLMQFDPMLRRHFWPAPGESYEDADRRLVMAALAGFQGEKIDLVVVHLDSTDWIAHECGVHGARYREVYGHVDDLIRMLDAVLPADATLMVLGDHGHDETGTHKTGLDIPSAICVRGPGFLPGADLGSIDITDVRYLLSWALKLPVGAQAYDHARLSRALRDPGSFPAFARGAEGTSQDRFPITTVLAACLLIAVAWLAPWFARPGCLLAWWTAASLALGYDLVALPLGLLALGGGTVALPLGRLAQERSRIAPPLERLAPPSATGHGGARETTAPVVTASSLVSAAPSLGLRVTVAVAALALCGWGALLTSTDLQVPRGVLVVGWIVPLAVALPFARAHRERVLWLAAAVLALAVEPAMQLLGLPRQSTEIWVFLLWLALLPRERWRERALPLLLTAAMLARLLLSSTRNGIAPPTGMLELVPLAVLAAVAKLWLFSQWGRSRGLLGLAVLLTALLAGVQWIVLPKLLHLDAKWVDLGLAVAFVAARLAFRRNRPVAAMLELALLFLAYYDFVDNQTFQYAWMDCLLAGFVMAGRAADTAEDRGLLLAIGLVLTFHVTVTWCVGGLEWHALYRWVPARLVEEHVAYFVPWILLKMLLPFWLVARLLARTWDGLDPASLQWLRAAASARACALLAFTCGLAAARDGGAYLTFAESTMVSTVLALATAALGASTPTVGSRPPEAPSPHRPFV